MPRQTRKIRKIPRTSGEARAALGHLLAEVERLLYPLDLSDLAHEVKAAQTSHFRSRRRKKWDADELVQINQLLHRVLLVVSPMWGEPVGSWRFRLQTGWARQILALLVQASALVEAYVDLPAVDTRPAFHGLASAEGHLGHGDQ